MKRYQDEEEKRQNKAYMKHPCRNCVWATWQQKKIVVCLFPRCVKYERWR